MQNNLPLTPIQLDVSSAIKLTKSEGMFKERSLMARNDAWHRIKIIHGAKYDKEFVLQAILAAADPADLIPVRYQEIGPNDTCFIARNCAAAIEKLCKNNLIIKVPNSDPLILVVTLAYASIQDLKVSIQPLLLTTLTKRYDDGKKSLDLNHFHRDPDIAKYVYCPLSQTRTFNHVLRLTKATFSSFEHLNLQNNQLWTLSALENSNLMSIKSLDLRNNNLIGMEALTPIRILSITELWLDGNPLCENYSSPKRYIESAKKYCPYLQKLDGIELDIEYIPLSINNYFPKKSVELLVKQFATHYFAISDNQSKRMLKEVYHQNSIYSLTVKMAEDDQNELPNQRQLMSVMKGTKMTVCGFEAIANKIRKLPKRTHLLSTFRYDVLHSGATRTIFAINGFFKFANSEQLVSFSRTFSLLALPNNEFKVGNDLHLIDLDNLVMPTNYGPKMARESEGVPQKSTQQKEEALMQLMNLTTMNREWCYRFLEDAKWNLKLAVYNFADDYKTRRVPMEAF